MFTSRFVLFICLIGLVIGRVSAVWACDFCTIADIGKKDQRTYDHKVEVRALYENQNWDEIPAADAHQLHHQGHHAHDKQNEEIIHTLIDIRPVKRLSLDIDVLYVTRHYIEIDSHARLGRNEISRGLGDITITGDYRLIDEQEKSLGVIAGVKVPSGGTKELNSGGERAEPELQPGSGSADYIAGLAGSLHPGLWDLSANAVYIYRTEGAQDFRFGDLLSVSFFAGWRIEINNKVHIQTGITLNNQLEKKQNDVNGDIKDSGGFSMFAGPQFKVNYPHASLEASYLFPAVQNLGGVHQELNGIWTGALSFRF